MAKRRKSFDGVQEGLAEYSDRQIVVTVLNMLSRKQTLLLLKKLKRDYG